MIELYAVTDAPGPPLPGRAVARVLPSGRLAVVYAPAVDVEASADALWRHEELVEALMEQTDLLPFRYGTRCEDEDAAERQVEEREAELSAALERIRGAVQLSVRVRLAEVPAAPRSGGGNARALHSPQAAAAGRRGAGGGGVGRPSRFVSPPRPPRTGG